MQMKANVQSSTERNTHYKLQVFNLKLVFLLSHHCPYNIYNFCCHCDINIIQMMLITLTLKKELDHF